MKITQNYENLQLNGKMKRNVVLAVFLTVCFLRTCQLSSLKRNEGLCIIAVIIVRGSALPSYFYEMMDDFDDLNAKNNLFTTTRTQERFKPTTSTTEGPIQDEWKLRGEYRLKCVDEVGVGPKKVVRLMTIGGWDDRDLDLKKWVLCVLNKMGLMSMQGVFRMDVAMSKIYKKDKAAAESLIDHCLPKKSMEAHEIAWQYVKCHNKAKGNFSAISVF